MYIHIHTLTTLTTLRHRGAPAPTKEGGGGQEESKKKKKKKSKLNEEEGESSDSSDDEKPDITKPVEWGINEPSIPVPSPKEEVDDFLVEDSKLTNETLTKHLKHAANTEPKHEFKNTNDKSKGWATSKQKKGEFKRKRER